MQNRGQDTSYLHLHKIAIGKDGETKKTPETSSTQPAVGLREDTEASRITSISRGRGGCTIGMYTPSTSKTFEASMEEHQNNSFHLRL
jgi:hypothetical protein